MIVKFEVYSDGTFWCARGIGVDIFTQGKTLDALMKNIKESVKLHFEDELGKGEHPSGTKIRPLPAEKP